MILLSHVSSMLAILRTLRSNFPMLKQLFTLIGLFIPLGYLSMGALSFFKPEMGYLMMPIYALVSAFLIYWAFGEKLHNKSIALAGVVASFSFLGFFTYVLSNYTLFSLKERLFLLGMMCVAALVLSIVIVCIARFVQCKRVRSGLSE
jgi:hypothetical protein